MKGLIIIFRKIFYITIFAGTIFTLFSTQIQAQGLTPLQATGADILGWELQVIGHETGHALTTFLTGGKVHSFEPYPHICGGMLVGGCVKTSGGFTPAVLAMGSLTSTLINLAVTPYSFDIQNPFLYRTIRSMLWFQMLDLFFYVMIDTFKYGGDWFNFSKITKIPTFVLIPLGVLNAWLLYQNRKYWYGKKVLGKKDLPLALDVRYKF